MLRLVRIRRALKYARCAWRSATPSLAGRQVSGLLLGRAALVYIDYLTISCLRIAQGFTLDRSRSVVHIECTFGGYLCCGTRTIGGNRWEDIGVVVIGAEGATGSATGCRRMTSGEWLPPSRRWSPSSSTSWRSRSTTSGLAPVKRTTQRWVRPNARCPVCGAPVYFYANEHGSRVYFDELGPPWPKHPCTAGTPGPVTASSAPSRPIRSPNHFVRTDLAPLLWSPEAGPVPSAPGGEPTTFGPMPVGATTGAMAGRAFLLRLRSAPLVVVGRWIQDTGTIIHLHPAGQPGNISAWRSPYHLIVAPGDCAFFNEGWISYFDRHLFEPRATPVIFLGMLPREEAPIVRFFRWLSGR
jgi:hypothetical protein